MTITRRVSIAVASTMIIVLVVAAMGIGVMVWLRSWRIDFVSAYNSGAKGTTSSMLTNLGSQTTTTTIVIAIVACAALAVVFVLGFLLRRMIRTRLRAAVLSMGGSASELLSVASQVAAAAAQTAAATNETTVTVEEVKQTALLAQERAAEAAGMAQEVADRSDHGRGSAQRNRGRFDVIGSGIDLVTESINRLSDQAQSVGDIITTVNDLAEQSNLLSVNAAIEAAKAGDYGKGFTVVAQEVKALAEQSKQAAFQARGVLSEIQKASGQAVRAVEENRSAVEIGREEVAEAIESRTTEHALASRAADAASQISATSRQQLAGMEQISQALASINGAGTQSVSGTRQLENEVKHLQELAKSIERMIDKDRDRPGGTVKRREAALV